MSQKKRNFMFIKINSQINVAYISLGILPRCLLATHNAKFKKKNVWKLHSFNPRIIDKLSPEIRITLVIT